MKNEIIIAFFCLGFVLLASFLIFYFHSSLTGFAVYNESLNASEIAVKEENVAKELAETALKEAESILGEMQKNNFSILYMNDTLNEAKILFEQVKYAEIIRDPKAPQNKKQEARLALRLVKWGKISYNDVLIYTDKIKGREKRAFAIYDSIEAEETKMKDYKETDVATVMQILEEAKKAFYEDRYDDAENLIQQAGDKFEQLRIETSTLSGIKRGAQNFFLRYWPYIFIFLILAGIFSYFSYKKVSLKLLKNKIRKMKTEEGVLVNLMKKAQVERFKENKISGLVYNIRMKKYQERLNEIKEELPGLEARLEKKLGKEE